MGHDWTNALSYDPITPLVNSHDMAISLNARRHLLDDEEDLRILWDKAPAKALLRRQRPDGGWSYRGGNPRVRIQENYDQIETFRNLGELVEKHGFTREHPSIERACEFLLSHQTREGDIRGILGRQYAPYYTAAMMELMIKAGYQDDDRIVRGFEWLISMRQDDEGWALPLRTRGLKLEVISMKMELVEPDRTKPSSHLITGMVLRAFASHPVQEVAGRAASGAASLLQASRKRRLSRQGRSSLLDRVLLPLLVHRPSIGA